MQKDKITIEEAEKVCYDLLQVWAYNKETQEEMKKEIRDLAEASVTLLNAVIRE